jgi:sRNA-binding protein
MSETPTPEPAPAAPEAPAHAPPAASPDPIPTPEQAVAEPVAAAAATPGAMVPAECAQRLKALFPALFSGAPKPLKLRIQLDIQERAPGVFTKAVLSAFFRRHTGSTSYLIAMTRMSHRYDLDGQPAGEISQEHRQVALDELKRRRAGHEARRELEEQQQRNRATLLRDFQATTLTKANFCALKGVAVEEFDGLLEIARAEAAERARQPAPFRPAAPRRSGRRDGPAGG